jgi:hypothetical protein
MRAPQRPVDAAGQGRVLSCHGARFIRSATSEASADDGAPTRWRGHARIVRQRVHCPWAVEPEEAGETEGLAQPQLACVPATARSVPSAERSGEATARGTGRAATAGRSAPTTRTHSCCRRRQSLRSAAYWPGNAAGSLRATPGLSRHAALRAAALRAPTGACCCSARRECFVPMCRSPDTQHRVHCGGVGPRQWCGVGADHTQRAVAAFVHHQAVSSCLAPSVHSWRFHGRRRRRRSPSDSSGTAAAVRAGAAGPHT